MKKWLSNTIWLYQFIFTKKLRFWQIVIDMIWIPFRSMKHEPSIDHLREFARGSGKPYKEGE